MRWICLSVCFLSFAGWALSQSRGESLTPQKHAEMALAHLRRVPAADAPYLRFLSWLGTPESELASRQAVMRFWINSLSREPDVEFPQEVPGSGGLLWAVDIRDYNWSVVAFLHVARREPYFREPWIKSETAAALRAILYVGQDRQTFHAEAIVRADWFFRETVETDRSQSYYDLLFARERHGDKAYWPGGQNYSLGWYFKGKDGGKVDANFPKNEQQWEQFFGADVVLNFLRKQKLRVQHGAIVEEGVSIVARNNRLLIRTPIPAGTYWATKDVIETSGKRDFAEQLIFDFQHDASEYIASLPNGGHGYLLSNGQGNRVETADPKVAIDSTDARDRRVRNPGSCVVCHGGGPGINRPENLVEQFIKDGLDIRFRDKEKLRQVRAFFLGWDRKLKQDQEQYADFVLKTSGMKPEENAAAFKRFRDDYDAPVGLKQAARETGLTEQQFVTLANASLHARPLLLARGRTVPRRVFEQDVYREIMLLTVARK